MTSNDSRFRKRDIPFWMRVIWGYAIMGLITSCVQLAWKYPPPGGGLPINWFVIVPVLLMLLTVVPYLLSFLAWFIVAQPAIRWALGNEQVSIISTDGMDELPRISPGEDLVEESE